MGIMHSVAVTITDNDVATLTAPTAVTVPEGGASNLPMALSAQPTANVTLTIAGHTRVSDLSPAPTVLTFTPATWSVAQTVTLTADDDDDVMDDPVTLTLSASGGGYAGVTHSVAVTITDNDTETPLSLSIYDLQVMEDAQTGTTARRVEPSFGSGGDGAVCHLRQDGGEGIGLYGVPGNRDL